VIQNLGFLNGVFWIGNVYVDLKCHLQLTPMRGLLWAMSGFVSRFFIPQRFAILVA
jgi:hypothetical protein